MDLITFLIGLGLIYFLMEITKGLERILEAVKSWEKKDLAKHDEEHNDYHTIKKNLKKELRL